MAGRFDIKKIGQLFGFAREEDRIEAWRVRVSLMNHLSAVVNTRAYEVTIGNFLRNAKKMDLRNLRSRKPKSSTERLAGRLEAWDELENYINNSIKNGQDAITKLQEIENNVRAKHAS